jgi:hypothetical protein
MPIVFFGASPLLPYSRHSPLLAHYRLAAAVPQVEVVEAGLPGQAGATAPRVAGIPQVEVAEFPREVVGVPVMGAAVLQQEVVAVIQGLAILEVAAAVIRSVAAAALVTAVMR